MAASGLDVAAGFERTPFGPGFCYRKYPGPDRERPDSAPLKKGVVRLS